MRLRALFAFAALSSLLVGACGQAFTGSSSADAGSSSAGQSEAGTASGGAASTAGNGSAGDAHPSAGSSGADNGGGSAGSMSLAGSAGTAGSIAAAGSGGGNGCNGGSACVTCMTAKDCPAQTTTCKANVCDGTAHTCSVEKLAVGTACKDNGGIVCNASGACVTTHCGDGALDADETDVDCGGSCGATCKAAAPQQQCKVGADCVSGVCSGSPLLCQPACSTPCTLSCQSCTLPGKVGTCTPYPTGVDDTKNFCFMQATCDSGACGTALNKAHFGDACSQDTDCYNGACGAGTCKLKNGDPCAEAAACKSGRCAAKTCAPCATSADCESGVCNAGACLLPPGYLCAAGTDCATGNCIGKECQANTGACVPSGCPTHFCKNNLCQTCSSSSDCPLNTVCNGGGCLLPAGAYCSTAASCASGACAAADLLSMPKCK